MASDPNRRVAAAPEAILSTGADQPMSTSQAAVLRELSLDAYEPDAFSARLTSAEAEQRIATLRAKLKLLDAPPHTL